MALENNENFYIGFFLLLALTGWLFSQPPWWQFGKIRILMPSFFMYKVLPMYRAYCRFGILVMLAVAVLAGFGLKFLLEKFKSQKVKIIITCLFSSLVLFEFFSYPPFKVIDLSKYPRAYDWLKQQPSDVVIAEYPLGVDGVNEMYKFYQIKHEKKMINGSTPGTQANEIARLIEKLSHPRSAGILKWLGVKYVFVHTDKYQESNLVDVKDDFRAIKRNLGLKFVKSFDDIDVYEVIAKPIKPEIIE